MHDRKQILAAIGDTAGEPQLHVIEEQARALDAEVLLVHVLRRSDAHTAAGACAYLDTLVDHFASKGIHARATLSRSGRLAATLVAEARRIEAAAIVLGISQRPALLAAVVGSVSAAIQRSAPCPVILVERPSSTGSTSPLWDFAAAAGRAGPLTRRAPRMRTVEIERIVGSVDRSKELGMDFRPLRRARRRLDDDRLQAIRRALMHGQSLPSIELYQLGYGFYVLDGHHRVAAARLLGQAAIDANVVEFVPVHTLAS